MVKRNSEDFQQIFIVSFLKKLQIIDNCFEFWHTPNGGSRNIAEASKLKMMGVLSGVPDITIMGKNKIRFIELKKSDGKLSKDQKSFIDHASEFGFPVAVIYGDHPKDFLPSVMTVMSEFGFDQNTMNSASSKVLGSSFLI